MARFPVIPPNEQTDVQKTIEDRISALLPHLPPQVELRDESGLALGPYAPLFYTDDIVDPWFSVAGAVNRQSRFTPREKELAILAVLSEYDAPYVLYAHSEISLRAGLSKEQIQDAVDGKLPQGLEEKEATAYSFAVKLAKLHGPMDSETFENAAKILGRDRVAGLVHTVSGFIYVAMLTNVSDAGVPPTKEGMFTARKNPAFK